MSEPITLTVTLFGALSQYAPNPIQVEIPSGSTVEEAKIELSAALKRLNAGFSDEIPLKRAVLATDTQVLTGATRLNESTALAALPPVCGG